MILYMNFKSLWLFGMGEIIETNRDVHQVDVDWIVSNSIISIQGQFNNDYVYTEEKFQQQRIVVNLLFNSEEIHTHKI